MKTQSLPLLLLAVILSIECNAADAEKKKKAETVEIRGQISAIDNSVRSFTCKKEEAELTIGTSDKTLIKWQGTKEDFNAIKQGRYVIARSTKYAADKTIARQIDVEPRPGRRFGFAGKVTAVDPEKKTFTCTKANGKTRVLTVSDDTLIEKDNAKVDFSKLAAGFYAAGRCGKVDKIYEVDIVRIAERAEDLGPSAGEDEE